jgi:hypothetical protein
MQIMIQLMKQRPNNGGWEDIYSITKRVMKQYQVDGCSPVVYTFGKQ